MNLALRVILYSIAVIPINSLQANTMSHSSDVTVYATSHDLEQGLEKLLRAVAADSISKRDKFMLGVSGGSMIKQLSTVIPKIYPAEEEAWEKWHIFFCDERIVPFTDKSSTFGAFKEDLLSKIPALESQFVAIDPSKDPEGNARFYHNQLVKHFGNAMWPVFDLLLLGMGPDGHTCSLFPGHPLLNEKKAWVAAIVDSPKPPPGRITFTLPVVNHARNVAFVVTGAAKADVLKNILEEENSENFPSGMVRPQAAGGALIWMLDQDAGAKLNAKKELR